jgi:DNA-directed RNA polymerase specialized sigma24 family protein
MQIDRWADIEPHLPELQKAARRYTRSADDAHDLLVDVLLRLSGRKALGEVDDMPAYLQSLMFWETRLRFKGKQVARRTLTLEDAPEPSEPARQEYVTELNLLRERLPPLLKAQMIDDKPIKQIAEETGYCLSSVQAKLKSDREYFAVMSKNP